VYGLRTKQKVKYCLSNLSKFSTSVGLSRGEYLRSCICLNSFSSLGSSISSLCSISLIDEHATLGVSTYMYLLSVEILIE
jgi:hypothetical protein